MPDKSMPKNKQPSKPPLDPTAPEIIRKFEWLRQNWRQYKLATFVFVALAVLGWGALPPVLRLFQATIFGPASKPGTSAPSEERVAPPRKIGAPAFRVQFTDGRSAYVGLHIAYAVRPDAVMFIVTNFRSPDDAASHLLQAVRSAALKALERRSLPEARLHRTEIEAEIANITLPAQKHTGHDLRQISILEIDEIR